MLTQIINARILTPQGWLKDGSVLIRDNKILEVTNCDLAIIGAKLIDAKGMYIVPGRCRNPCSWWRWKRLYGRHRRGFPDSNQGSHAAWYHQYFSYPFFFYHSDDPCSCGNYRKMMAEPNSPVLGLHLEGHYFNIDMAGGQIPENIKDSRSRRIYSVVGRNTLYQTLGCRTGTSRSHAIR